MQKVSLIVVLLISSLLAQTVPEQKFTVLQADMPVYPQVVRAMKMSATVKVDVTVKKGEVVETHVKSFSSNQKASWTDQLLVTPTLENLKTWKFAPANNGTFTTTFVYEIDNEETPYPENPKIEMQLPTSVKLIVKRTKPTCNGPDSACRDSN